MLGKWCDVTGLSRRLRPRLLLSFKLSIHSAETPLWELPGALVGMEGPAWQDGHWSSIGATVEALIVVHTYFATLRAALGAAPVVEGRLVEIRNRSLVKSQGLDGLVVLISVPCVLFLVVTAKDCLCTQNPSGWNTSMVPVMIV